MEIRKKAKKRFVYGSLCVFALFSSSASVLASDSSDMITGMMTFSDLKAFWFVPIIFFAVLFFVLRSEIWGALKRLRSGKKDSLISDSLMSDEEKELFKRIDLSKRLREDQLRREASLRRIAQRASGESNAGSGVLSGISRVLGGKGSPDTVGGQLAAGHSLEKSGVVAALEKLISENKVDHADISKVVASIEADVKKIQDKQGKMDSRNKKLGGIQKALVKISEVRGTVQDEAEALRRLKVMQADLGKITSRESQTFAQLVEEFREAEKDLHSISQACSVIATIASQMRAQVASSSSNDASFEARKSALDKLQENAVRLQALLAQKRERLAEIIPKITKMREDIALASIEDLERLQEARRVEAELHRGEVSRLTADIAAKDISLKDNAAKISELKAKRDTLIRENSERQVRIDELDKRLRAAESKAKTSADAKAEAERLHAEIVAEKQRQVEAITSQMASVQAELDARTAALGDAASQLASAKKKVEELDALKRSLEESVSRSEETISDLRAQIAQRIGASVEELARLSEEEKAKHTAALGALRTQLEERIRRIEEEKRKAEESILALTVDLRTARTQASSFEAAAKKAKAEKVRSDEELKVLRESVDKKEKEIAAELRRLATERDGIAVELEKTRKSLERLAKEKESSERELGLRRSEAEAITRELEDLRSRLRKIESAPFVSAEEHDKLIQKRRDTIKKLIAFIRDMKKKSEEDTLRHNAELIALRAQVDEASRLKSVAESERETLKVEVARRKREEEDLKARFSALMEEKKDLDDRIKEIRQKTAGEVTASLQSEIDDLQRQLEEKVSELRQLSEELKEVKVQEDRAIAAEQDSRARLAEAVHSHSLATEQFESRVQEQFEDIQRLEAEVLDRQQALDAERGRISDTERQVAELTAQIARIQQEYSEELSDLGVRAADMIGEREKDLQEYYDAQLGKLQEKLRIAEENLGRLEKVSAENVQLAADRESLVSAAANLRAQLEKAIAALGSRIAELESDVSGHKKRIAELEPLRPLEAKTAKQETELVELRRELSNAQTSLGSARSEYAKVKDKLDALRGSVLASSKDALEEAERQQAADDRLMYITNLNAQVTPYLREAIALAKTEEFDSALRRLDLAELRVQEFSRDKLASAQMIAETYAQVRSIRDHIATLRTKAVRKVKDTVWCLFPFDEEKDLSLGYFDSGAASSIVNITQAQSVYSRGFVLNRSALLGGGISVGKSDSKSDVVLRSDDPSIDEVGDVHVRLKQQKDSSILFLSAPKDNKVFVFELDASGGVLLKEGKGLPIDHPKIVVLGSTQYSRYKFLLKPVDVSQDTALAKKSSVELSKCFIDYPVQLHNLDEFGTLTLVSKYKYDLEYGGQKLREVVLWKNVTTLGRKSAKFEGLDVEITAKYKEDIAGISRKYSIEKDTKGRFSIVCAEPGSMGGVFTFVTEEVKRGEYNTCLVAHDGPFGLVEGTEFYIDREGDFGFVFHVKKKRDIKVLPKIELKDHYSLGFGEENVKKVGVLRPSGFFEIFEDGKKTNTDKVILWKDISVIGRHETADIKINGNFIMINTGNDMKSGSELLSRHHAMIKNDGGKFIIVDNSANGTFLLGRKIGKGNSANLAEGHAIILNFGPLDPTNNSGMIFNFEVMTVRGEDVPDKIPQYTVIFKQSADQNVSIDSDSQTQKDHTASVASQAASQSVQVSSESRIEKLRATSLHLAVSVPVEAGSLSTDGRSVSPQVIRLVKPVTTFGTGKRNDVVLSSDRLSEMQLFLFKNHARIEIVGSDAYLVSDKMTRWEKHISGKTKVILVNGMRFEIDRPFRHKIHPINQTPVEIGFGGPLLRVVFSVTELRDIPENGRQWKQAFVKFKTR